jgi:hypothetical protein
MNTLRVHISSLFLAGYVGIELNDMFYGIRKSVWICFYTDDTSRVNFYQLKRNTNLLRINPLKTEFLLNNI